jgi:hypothetical protein
MHKIFHEVIAAIGGILFIVIGIARLRERRRLIRAGIKTESPILWNLFIIIGICLTVFALGVLIYKLNRLPG